MQGIRRRLQHNEPSPPSEVNVDSPRPFNRGDFGVDGDKDG